MRVGAYEVLEEVGRGGFGVVWRVRRDGVDRPLAIKVLTADGAQLPRVRRALRSEARAIARLSHPAVVAVHDVGDLPPGLEVQGPYLVMDFHPSTLEDTPLDWAALDRALRALLAGLAHAHARGVFHLDIKPANVLVDVAGRPVLADFGIAALLGREGDLRTSSAGSPWFMAPEQQAGAWRDVGPWTDLFALGRTVRRLANPLEGPALQVPEGLLAWAEQLTATEPIHRFPSAPAAARALLRLGPPITTLPAPEGSAGGTTTFHLDAPEPVVHAIPPGAPFVPVPDQPPPQPAHRRPLPGTGLGLVGVRALPLVGREADQDALWTDLVRAARIGRPQVVLLHGPAGVGKTRLVDWLCTTVEEHGYGRALVAHHGEEPGPGQGIAGMVARELRCHGDTWAHTLERVAARSPGLPPASVASLAAPTLVDPPAHPPSAIERHALWVRWVQRHPGVPLVVLDDGQWAADALEAALRLADSDGAAVVLVTVRDEALPERPVERELLERLEAHPSCRRHAVRPLDDGAVRELLDSTLGLEVAVGEQVRERAAGNPLLALELVADWAARGVLLPSASGFRAHEGASLELPASLRSVWSNRLEALLREEDWPRVELLAVIGIEFDEGFATRAAALAGLPDPAEALDLLLGSQLVHRARRGAWRFAHGMLRETLVALAEAEGVLPRLSRACAEAWEGSPSDVRLARYLEDAGERERALDVLVAALPVALERETTAHASTVLDRALALADAIGLDAADPVRLRLALFAAHRVSWQNKQAGADAFRALWMRAEELGLGELAAEALVQAVAKERTLGADTSVADLRQALEQGRLPPPADAEAAAALASVDWLSGRLEAAAVWADRAVELAEAHGDAKAIARAYYQACRVAYERGDTESARRFIDAGAEYVEQASWLGAQPPLLSTLADLEEREGNLEEADQLYAEAARVARLLMTDQWLIADLNRTLLALADGRDEVALDLIGPVRDRAEALGWTRLHAPAELLLATAATRLGDRDRARSAFDVGRRLLEGGTFQDTGLNRTIGGLLAAALERGDDALAEDVRALAGSVTEGADRSG